jgi:hypothetical protein
LVAVPPFMQSVPMCHYKLMHRYRLISLYGIRKSTKHEERASLCRNQMADLEDGET